MSVIDVGGNLSQLDTLSATFRREAEDVGRLIGSIDRQVVGTDWRGAVANEFRDRWNGEFKTSLNNLIEALTQCATVVDQRRAALDQATNVMSG